MKYHLMKVGNGTQFTKRKGKTTSFIPGYINNKHGVWVEVIRITHYEI